MIRRLLLALLVALVGSTVSAQDIRDSVGTGHSAVTPSGGLRLVNRHDVELSVEIRIATDRGCEGALIKTVRVAARATTQFRSSQSLCIRRESLSVNGARIKSDWERKETPGTALTEVVL